MVSYSSELYIKVIDIFRKKLVFIIGFVYSAEIKLQLKPQCYNSTGFDSIYLSQTQGEPVSYMSTYNRGELCCTKNKYKMNIN